MNRKEYKKSMSGIHPSDQVVERIMDMTNDKKARKGLTFKRLASTALALAILVGGGYGVNQLIDNESTRIENNTHSVQRTVNPLSVMVAYAEDGETKEKVLELGVNTPIKYNLEIYDIRNKSEKEIEKLKDELRSSNLQIKEENLDTLSVITGTESLDNIILRKMIYNSFVLDIKDPTTVKSINLKTNTEFWYLNYFDQRDDVTLENAFPKGKDLTIDGETYAELLEALKEHGYEGFYINLEHDMNLCSAIDKNPEIDLSNFNDTLTFTVEYKDGTVEQAKIDISLNQNGALDIKLK